MPGSCPTCGKGGGGGGHCSNSAWFEAWQSSFVLYITVNSADVWEPSSKQPGWLNRCNLIYLSIFLSSLSLCFSTSRRSAGGAAVRQSGREKTAGQGQGIRLYYFQILPSPFFGIHWPTRPILSSSNVRCDIMAITLTGAAHCLAPA